MKDNGKMEVVKNCGTCQHLGKSERCQNCRNGNPPADAAAYDLLWEAAVDEAYFVDAKSEVKNFGAAQAENAPVWQPLGTDDELPFGIN